MAKRPPAADSENQSSRTQYYHYFSFRLDGYIDQLLLRVRGDIFATFLSELRPEEVYTILDVGVSADDHASSNFLERNYPHLNQITAVGIECYPELEKSFPGLKFVQADGRKLPFEDRCFDIVHSHAVIEHVGSREKQAEFISELTRVARRGIMITTPNRWHPVETHTGLPFLHFLPPRIYRALYRALGKEMYAEERSLNLISAKELVELCRVSGIREERMTLRNVTWLGLPSNLILCIDTSNDD